MQLTMTVDPAAACAELAISPDYSQISEWTGEWIVAVVDGQHLQRSIDTIEGFEVPTWAPRVSVKTWRNGRNRTLCRSLFPGYLFCCVPDIETMLPDHLRDWHIFEIIRVNNQTKLRSELSELQKVLQLNPYATLHNGLKEGVAVNVISGPFRGLTGIVETLGNRDRLYVRITTMNQSVSVELGSSQVEAA